VPLLLRHLLDDPGLGLELIAGRAGLATRGPVRWAHISEIPDPTPWLEGGEILLTTGLGVRDSPDLQRRLVAGLDARGCPGLGFGLGVVMDAVPAALLEEAETRALPLFTVPYELPFIAVTKRVSREVFSEHDQTLRTAVDLHRSVLAAVLGGAGLRGVLDMVARLLPGIGFVVFDYYGQVIGRAARANAPAADPARLWAAVGGGQQKRDHGAVAVDELFVEASVIRIGDEIEAVLATYGSRALQEHERLLLEQAVTGVSLELTRGQSVRESHRARVDELLQEVAENRIGLRTLGRQLHRLGLVEGLGYRVLCLRSDQSGVSQRVLCGVAEDALGQEPSPPILGRYDGAVYCIVQPAADEQAGRIAGAVRARGWREIEIGRSRPKTDIEALDAAMREAAAAAERAGPGGITDVDELGLPGILAGLGPDEASQAFVAKVLGPVVAHDEREGSQLVRTLQAYLSHGCRPGPAAAELSIHRHTLAYRLDRVTALTGRDLRDGDAIVEVGLALRLHAAAGDRPA
jgi:purine catabolism regulator